MNILVLVKVPTAVLCSNRSYTLWFIQKAAVHLWS